MDALQQPQKGLTPIIATVILTAMVLTLAVSAMTFLQGQQGAISEQLQDALDDDVIIEETLCNGHQVTFTIANNGEERIETSTAELIVFEGQDINYSFATDTIVLNGSFQRPGTTGRLNISTDAVFRSGNRYTIQLAFEEFTIDRQCVAGQSWWNIDWDHRRQIVVENTDDTTKTDAIAAIDLNTTALIETGRMNPDCSDLQVIEDGTERPHDLDSCTTDGDLTELRFRTTVNRSDTEYDTYLYYSNLRADMDETDLGTPDDAIETRFRPEEQQ
jgi:flagellin-like protein